MNMFILMAEDADEWYPIAVYPDPDAAFAAAREDTVRYEENNPEERARLEAEFDANLAKAKEESEWTPRDVLRWDAAGVELEYEIQPIEVHL